MKTQTKLYAKLFLMRGPIHLDRLPMLPSLSNILSSKCFHLFWACTTGTLRLIGISCLLSLSSQTQKPVSWVPLGLRNKIRLKTWIRLHSGWVEIWEALNGHHIATELSNIVLLEHFSRIMNNTGEPIAKLMLKENKLLKFAYRYQSQNLQKMTHGVHGDWNRDYCLEQKGRLFQRQYDSSLTMDEGIQIGSTIPAFLRVVS